MAPSPHAIALQEIADQLADLLTTQASELREYARAAAAGEGTIQLEKNLRSLELRRADLYLQFEQAVDATRLSGVQG